MYKIRCHSDNYVVMDKSKNLYISYSIKTHGELAYKMAEISSKTGIRIGNYYEIIDNNTAILYMHTKTLGTIKSYVDVEDLDMLLKYHWCPTETDLDRAYICSVKNKKKIKIHRIIMGLSKDSKYIVDHKNGNKFDNRKSNLRIVDNVINNRNFKLSKNNVTGVKGVYYELGKKPRVIATIYNDSYKQEKKTFSINKYGKSLALEMAKEWRKKKEKEYGYNTKIRKLFKK